MKVKRNKKSLTEATLDDVVSKAENDLAQGNDDVKVADVSDKAGKAMKSEIELILDDALDTAEENQITGNDNYTNVLLVGGAGIGKTAITKQWAKENNINLVIQNTSTMEETDLTGVIARSKEGNSTVKLKSDVLRHLNKPRSVLFLDEYNRGNDSVRGTLLTLIQDHLIDAGTDEEAQETSNISGKIKLDNFLFTIAAINPADENYNTNQLDDAEVSRFSRHFIKANKTQWLDYMLHEMEKQLDRAGENEKIRNRILGRMALLKKLVSDKAFQWDNEKDIAAGKDRYGDEFQLLNPRTLSNLISNVKGDSGNIKDEFLNKWNNYCNPMKKQLAATILSDFTDVDDKANSVFKKRAAADKTDEEKLDDFLNSF